MLCNCKLCGLPALEQVRGDLGPDDKGYVPPSSPGQESSNTQANASDTRIVCGNPKFYIIDGEKTWACQNATGWNKQDFVDYTQFVWNRDNAVQP